MPTKKITYFYDEENNKRGVILEPKEFEKIIEEIEDLLDRESIKQLKKTSMKTYSAEAVNRMLERKNRDD